ncbi:MAG: NTP transferase domain-containing protein [Actinobacteria bacterium]|nr:NTP transferase domain-containing protein [Actinomycetota bacterium]
MSRKIDKAVILARGLGTRMVKGNDTAGLDVKQEAVADTGVKALIPIDRPFLDYVLSVLAEAGYKKVALVIGPEHRELREYYGKELQTERLEISFAVQAKALGTADAVLAVEEFADGDDFLVINSDNHYPLEAVAGLRELGGTGTALFDREGMFAGSNIPHERLRAFAVAKMSDDGYLQRIIEKPDEQTLNSLNDPIYISMNCWRFGSTIFQACRKIKPSPRGELELPDAVQYAMDELGERFKVVCVKGAVLDLSYRSDVLPVAKKLANVEVKL